MSATDNELTECIRGLERAEDIVERTFRNAPDSFYKTMAERSIAMSRRLLEQVIDSRLSRNAAD